MDQSISMTLDVNPGRGYDSIRTASGRVRRSYWMGDFLFVRVGLGSSGDEYIQWWRDRCVQEWPALFQLPVFCRQT